jgi:hypothetical protein
MTQVTLCSGTGKNLFPLSRTGFSKQFLCLMGRDSLFQQAAQRLDIWGVDWLMKITLVSVLFTAFAVGGVANSINIIDGFNGLASFASFLAFVGYALIAWQVGDTTFAQVSMVIAACVGFLLCQLAAGQNLSGQWRCLLCGLCNGLVGGSAHRAQSWCLSLSRIGHVRPPGDRSAAQHQPPQG